MNLSKSKYCEGVQCKKILWLSKFKPEVKEEIDNESVLENGNYVHEIARKMFGNDINIEFNENLNTMINDTKKALQNENAVITEASFNYNNNFCSVDILKKEKDSFEIYEVKSSTKVKDVFINDASYQYYVLTSLGLNVKKCFVVTLNSNYVRCGDLDLSKLFIKNDITDICKNKLEEIKNNIAEINKYMENKNEPDDDIDLKCFDPYPCPFFKYCTRKLPENNVFTTKLNLKDKFKFYKMNVYSYEDLLKYQINDKTRTQIEYDLYNKDDFIDKKKIKEFLSELREPIYFLDFETFQMAIPKYDNVSPYMQVPFQYSLHYIKNGTLYHKEFLAKEGIDPRKDLAEALVKDIPTNVAVLAYNMSFEKNVIKKLAELYPDLKSSLMKIYSNIYDLMIPFRERSYYSKDMDGSYSIKYVLPALFPNDESLNYKNLDLIHNGSEAMDSFASLENKSEEEKKVIRENLLKYCKLDTYAMVKIYEKLKEAIK